MRAEVCIKRQCEQIVSILCGHQAVTEHEFLRQPQGRSRLEAEAEESHFDRLIQAVN